MYCSIVRLLTRKKSLPLSRAVVMGAMSIDAVSILESTVYVFLLIQLRMERCLCSGSQW